MGRSLRSGSILQKQQRGAGAASPGPLSHRAGSNRALLETTQPVNRGQLAKLMQNGVGNLISATRRRKRPAERTLSHTFTEVLL